VTSIAPPNEGRRLSRWLLWVGIIGLFITVPPGSYFLLMGLALSGISLGGNGIQLVFYGPILPILLILVSLEIRRRSA
jgi:hypothetical protein